MLWNERRKILIGLLSAAVLLGPHYLKALDFDGHIEGVVRNSSGTPVSGAFVKLVDAERHLTFMIISQDQGRYATDVPAGKYEVQAIGGDFQSALVPAEVASGRTKIADVSLTVARGPMLRPGYPSFRPDLEEYNALRDTGVQPPFDATLPDGEGKKVVETVCTRCHDLGTIVVHRGNEGTWAVRVNQMKEMAEETTSVKPPTDEEESIIVAYLAKNYPDRSSRAADATMGGEDSAGVFSAAKKVDPNSRLPRTLLTGAATKYRIVQYDVPPPIYGFREYAQDSDGVVWLASYSNPEGYIGRFDPKTLTLRLIPVPRTGATKAAKLNGLAKGLGDDLWMTDDMNRRLIQFNTKSEQFNIITIPKQKWGTPTANTSEIAKDGTVWWTAIRANAIMSYNPETRQFSSYDVPTGLKYHTRTSPYGMAIAGDGKIWFVESYFNNVGMLDPDTGKIEEFPIPIKGFAEGKRVTADANGDIWVGIHWGEGGKLLKIDHITHKMTVYSPPSQKPGLYAVGADKKNNLIYAAEDNLDIIARFDPKTERWVEYPLPQAENDTRRINVDFRNPNRIWYTGVGSNHIGYIELLDANGKPK